MYFDFFVVELKTDYLRLKTKEKKELGIYIPARIAKEKNKSVLGMYFKMMYSMLLTGCTFSEYYNLGFVNRTIKNQSTFLTSGSNLRAYEKMNNKEFNKIYIDKCLFNKTYNDFIGREWIELVDSKIAISFFEKHDDIVIKPQNGHSGIGVFVLHNCKSMKADEIINLIKKYPHCIAEEMLQNHPEISKLNASSLNTLRIITVKNNEGLNIIFAGIRFGADGKEVDNISQGGYVAAIDVKDGKISCVPHQKMVEGMSKCEEKRDLIGFKIPCWDQLPEYMESLTSVVPQMRYMAWDIALTTKGFVTIEGNHSSGNTICQAHLGYESDGLKVVLDQCMKDI